jgi:hypothetical protein
MVVAKQRKYRSRVASLVRSDVASGRVDLLDHARTFPREVHEALELEAADIAANSRVACGLLPSPLRSPSASRGSCTPEHPWE